MDKKLVEKYEKYGVSRFENILDNWREYDWSILTGLEEASILLGDCPLKDIVTSNSEEYTGKTDLWKIFESLKKGAKPVEVQFTDLAPGIVKSWRKKNFRWVEYDAGNEGGAITLYFWKAGTEPRGFFK